MNTLDEEEKQEIQAPVEQEIPPAQAPRGDGLKRLSPASVAFDVGGKGYLDEEERIIREYDTNNDGTLDIDEVKKIIRALSKADKKKSKFMKVAIGASGVLVFVLLANFGLIWAVLVLTRQVETQNGKLIDASTGKLATTKGQGSGLKAELDPAWSRIMDNAQDEEDRRFLRAHKPGELWKHPLRRLRDHEDVRRLQGIPLASITNTKQDIQDAFDAYENGTLTHANLIHENGNTYSVGLASGLFQVTGLDCPTWRNIKEVNTECPTYKCECCADVPCQLFITEICPA